MIETQSQTSNESLRQIALMMMNAARTAPKARGIDNLEIIVLTGDDIVRLSNKLHELGVSSGLGYFVRDGENILQAGAVVLIGTSNKVMGLDCGLCGFQTCAEKAKQTPKSPCAFNMNDLGIAIGSAVSVAANHRADCRVMYSAGVATKAIGLLTDCHAILAIPISATGKNPFFDRKPL